MRTRTDGIAEELSEAAAALRLAFFRLADFFFAARFFGFSFAMIGLH